MPHRTRSFRALLLAGGALFLASWADAPDPVGLDDDMLVTSMQQVPDVSGDPILAVSKGEMARISEAVTDLGGSVVRSYDGAGILIASGLSDDAAADLAGSTGVKSMMADIMIQGSTDQDLASMKLDEAAHDPGKKGADAIYSKGRLNVLAAWGK